MKLTIEQAALSALLSRVIKAVESRNAIPILGNILLTATGDTLTAVGTDLDVEVKSTALAQVTQDGSTTVSASTLQAIVNKLSKGKLVTLSANDLLLTVESGRSKLDLGALEVKDFPRIANDEYESTFHADQPAVAKLFSHSAFAMSADETRYYLKGVYLHSPKGTARAVATDGHRLAKVDSDIAASFPGVIIPAKTVGLLSSLLDDGDVTVQVSKNKVRFDFGHSVVVSKVIDGTFPDYTRIIPTQHQTEVIVSAHDVKQAAALVTLVSGEKVRAVKVSASGDTLNLTVRSGAEVGVEDVDAEIAGPDITLGFNSKYLSDILSQCNGDNAVLRFNGSGDPVVVRAQEDDSAVYVLMPMRLN